jgi:hypothetical protein
MSTTERAQLRLPPGARTLDTLDELRREHSHMVCDLHHLVGQDIRQPDVLARLGDLHRRLRQHIEREATEVDAPLEAAGRLHRDIANTLRIFAADSSALTRRVLAFFERYGEGCARDDFSDACARALADLRERIRREETLLFPTLLRSQRGPSLA